MSARPKFVVAHQTCGHIIGYGNNRALALATKNKLTIRGFKGWMVQERDATDTELTQMVDAERCVHCTVDGNLRQVIR